MVPLPLVREGLTDGFDRMNTRLAIFLFSLSLCLFSEIPYVGYVGGLNNYYEIPLSFPSQSRELFRFMDYK